MEACHLMHTFVIAEAGSTWRFGDGQTQIENARAAIRAAHASGADAIKFQWTSDHHRMEKRRSVPSGSYEILAWPEEWIEHFAAYCTSHNLEFMCTVFLPCDVLVLNAYVKRWKVASLECDDTALIRAMRETGKPVIASHGANGDSGWRDGILADIYLHCTASYPAPLNQLNLNVIKTQVYEGYSDHSCNVLTGALAVACGAKIIEVHFKHDCTPGNNPDFAHSLYEDELRMYIGNIRQAEVMLGDGAKKVEKCEEWALKHKVRT